MVKRICVQRLYNDIMSDASNSIVVAAQENASVWRMVFLSMVVLLPAFSSGMSMALTSTILEHFSDKGSDSSPLEEPLTEEQGSWTVSVPLVSMMVGSLSSGALSDALGRRPTLLASNLLLLTSWLLLLFSSHTFQLLLLSRSVAGAAGGAAIACSYLLLGEISLVRWRGTVCACGTVAINCAWLTSLTLAACFPLTTCVALSAAPCVLALALAAVVPESPLWCARRRSVGAGERAVESALHRIRGQRYDCSAELKELVACVSSSSSSSSNLSSSYGDVAVTAAKPVLLLSALFACQVSSGCEILSYYSLYIFELANLHVNKYLLACLLQTAFTLGYLVATPIMSRVSRKKQFAVSSVVTGACMAAVGLCIHLQESEQAGYASLHSLRFIPPVATIAGCFAYGMGMGPVCFVLLGELFPSRTKALGSSLVLAFRYTVSFSLLKSFPSLASLLGLPCVFLGGSFACVCGAVLALSCLPETRELTLTQMETLFKTSRKKKEEEEEEKCPSA